ncbi:MAG: hypothetical protein FWC16_11380 [Defluviitaleaceae bacterium]|nr:hypothetical protein [Defluviitaleaceae bacterium]MCL2275520.1 hypothetical protein [Defluviitaleaceae bacterium]
MRINPLQTFNQNVNQGGKKIAGVRLPNFNYMNTQSTPKLSDDEIRARMVELGRKYAETGERNDDERNKLTRMYMSSVSPDRRGAITNALTALDARINALQMLSPAHTSMGEWLELLFGRALLNPNFSVNHLDVHDSNGNKIAIFNEQVGWREVTTDAEWARSRALHGLFSDAVHAARNGNPTIDITGKVIEPPTVDMKV